jgi:DNA-binding CsgD family transcriptional regulator
VTATASNRGGLLERDEPLARIERVLASAREGRGSMLVLEGRAGIGKTAMMGIARAHAREDGMRVLAARGGQLEREYAFGVVRQLFEPALAGMGEEPRADVLHGPAGVAAGLLGLPGARGGEPMAGADASFAALHGLYWLCANLAAREPLCLLIDDAHWADTASLRLLAFLLGRLEELRVGVVVAARPGEGGAGGSLLTELTTDSLIEVVRPAPLSADAVGRMVERELGASAHPEFVSACVHATGGTPFLVRELLAALREDAVPPSAAAADQVRDMGAPAIGRWMLVRLGRLSPPAAKLARAVAILERADVPQAAELSGLSVVEASAAADALTAAGILAPERPLAFVHPIIRAGVYGQLSGGDRALGHRRAAQLLDGSGVAIERVAEHLLASEPAGDAWVAERLTAVARAATNSGAPESAAVFLRRALDEPPAPADRAGLLLELGLAEESAGEPGWAEHLHAAVAAAEGPARIEAALVLAPALARAHRSAEAVEMIDRAASWLGTADEQLGAVLEAAAVTVGMIDADTAPALERRARALRHRAETDAEPAREILGVAAFLTALSNEPAEAGVELARRTLAAGSPLPDAANVAWFSQAAVTLLWAGRYEPLDPLLEAVIVRARGTGNSGLLSIGLSHRAWLALHRGDLRTAENDARTALEVADLPAPLLYRLLTAAILIEALVERGALDEAEEILAPLDADAKQPSISTAVLLHARGRLRAAQRRAPEAIDDFQTVGRLAARLCITCPALAPWRSEAALAHLASGDRDAARRLAEEELELARHYGAPRALGMSLRAAGVAAGGPTGEAHLREAVAALAGGDAALEQARATCELGALLRRTNRRAEARELLRPGLETAHRLGAQPLAERAETELRATGARPRKIMLSGLDALTASERRIAQLAGEGMTNREIAQALFVTARTVESHLTHVFGKLDLKSRDGLADALAAA